MGKKSQIVEKPSLFHVQDYINKKGLKIRPEDVYWFFFGKKGIYNGESIKTMVKKFKRSSQKQQKETKDAKRKTNDVASKTKSPVKNKKQKVKTPYVFIPYKKQLADVRWKRLREKVLNKRGHKCERCGSTENLQIHHLVYRKKRYAWQYGINDLVVLCDTCHLHAHNLNLDDEFFRITKNN